MCGGFLSTLPCAHTWYGENILQATVVWTSQKYHLWLLPWYVWYNTIWYFFPILFPGLFWWSNRSLFRITLQLCGWKTRDGVRAGLCKQKKFHYVCILIRSIQKLRYHRNIARSHSLMANWNIIFCPEMKAEFKLSISILPLVMQSHFSFTDVATSCPFMYLQASFVSSDLGAITEATKKSGKVKIRSECL